MSNLETVAIAYSVSEAAVIQSMLRAYGIPAFTFDSDTVNCNPALMVAVGGIRILVFGDDYEVAAALIWQDNAETEPPRSYSSKPVKNGVVAVLLALLGVAPPARVPLQLPKLAQRNE